MIRRLAPILAAICLCSLLRPAEVGAASSPIPSSERSRIHAVLSPYDFYPQSIPNGLIYTRWKRADLSPMACGTSVTIEFAQGNRQIVWSSSRDCDSRARVLCSSTGYPGYGFDLGADKNAIINGRKVFFSMGNHGSNAWACIPVRVAGSADMAVVGIWESNFMTPVQAMNLVAKARR
jgi:hypothetical protein